MKINNFLQETNDALNSGLQNDQQEIDNHVEPIENEPQEVNRPWNQSHVMATNIEDINLPTVIRPVKPYSRKREKPTFADQSTSKQAISNDLSFLWACSTPLGQKDKSRASPPQVKTLFEIMKYIRVNLLYYFSRFILVY